jgi:hypothetical protein
MFLFRFRASKGGESLPLLYGGFDPTEAFASE